MNTILNIHKLSTILPEQDLLNLDGEALLLKRYSNILFKIIVIDNDVIWVQIRQGRNLRGHLVDDETLINCTTELFQPYFSGNKIDVIVSPLLIPPVEVVNSKWIKRMMKETGIQIKDIVDDTGLNKSFLSAIVNGKKPLSQINKSFFYYYFTKMLSDIIFQH